jgi:hypothetical protein
LRLVPDDSRRLSREERELLRAQVDQAKRQAEKLGRVVTVMTASVEAVAAVLEANPDRRFSQAEIARILGFTHERAGRALLALEAQGRAANVPTDRQSRWQATETPHD